MKAKTLKYIFNHYNLYLIIEIDLICKLEILFK